MITLGTKKLELDKWQFRFEAGWRAPWLGRGFHPYFNLIVAKHHLRPEPGTYSEKGKHFKGIIWRWYLNYTLTMRTFVTPHWLRRLTYRVGLRPNSVYAFPVKIKFI